MAFLTSAGVTRERESCRFGLCRRWCDDPQLVGPSLLNDLHHVIIRYIMVGGLGHKGMFLRILIICGGSDVTSWVPVTLMASRMVGLSDLLEEN